MAFALIKCRSCHRFTPVETVGSVRLWLLARKTFALSGDCRYGLGSFMIPISEGTDLHFFSLK